MGHAGKRAPGAGRPRGQSRGFPPPRTRPASRFGVRPRPGWPLALRLAGPPGDRRRLPADPGIKELRADAHGGRLRRADLVREDRGVAPPPPRPPPREPEFEPEPTGF